MTAPSHSFLTDEEAVKALREAAEEFIALARTYRTIGEQPEHERYDTLASQLLRYARQIEEGKKE